MATTRKKCPECGKDPITILEDGKIACVCGYDETGYYPKKEEQSGEERARVQVPTGDRGVPGSRERDGGDEGRPGVDGRRRVDRGPAGRAPRKNGDEFLVDLAECWAQIDEDGYLVRAPGARRVLELLYERAMELRLIYVMASREWIGEQLGISGEVAGRHLTRLEELGWLTKIPSLADLKAKHLTTYWWVKKKVAEHGGRPITVVELRNNPAKKTLWKREAA